LRWLSTPLDWRGTCHTPPRWPRVGAAEFDGAFLSTTLIVCAALGNRAMLKLYEDADHSFHVPKKSGRTDAQVLDEVLNALGMWADDISHKVAVMRAARPSTSLR
jgi:hypothetical protein